MGFFSVFKQIKEEKNKQKHYLVMSQEEMCELNDEELSEVLNLRVTFYETYLDVGGILDSFEGAKRVYYIINSFDREIQNGGLCQFFVNSSRDVAPHLMEALKEIKADKYIEILEKFLKDNEIDLNDLSSFAIRRISEYEQQLARYPFDDFDDAYYDLYEEEALDELLFAYAKLHLEDFK